MMLMKKKIVKKLEFYNISSKDSKGWSYHVENATRQLHRRFSGADPGFFFEGVAQTGNGAATLTNRRANAQNFGAKLPFLRSLT